MAEHIEKKLFSEFQPVSTKEWEEQIIADLKGAEYDKKLVWRTIEGLSLRPYYRSEDLNKIPFLDTLPGEFPYLRSNKTLNNTWYIRQAIEVLNVNEANSKALDILMKGIDSLCFIINDAKQLTQTDFNALLNNICLTAVELNFDVKKGNSYLLELLKTHIKEKKIDAKQVHGSISYDPIGQLVMKGNFCQSAEHSFNRVKENIINSRELKNVQTIEIHANNFHNAGASIVQELAFALSQGAEYLTQISDLGISVDETAPNIKFTFAVGANYFMEIAKFRAARLLWAKIVSALKPHCNCFTKMNVHAVTSLWNQTVYDPYVNMLRSTTEAMAAVLAGVDSLTVEPYNKAYEKTTEFSERIARNQQIILKEESYFDKVIDPAAGSYYIEKLTDSIAQAAWKLFIEIEEKGGFIEAFKKEFIQKQIEDIAQKRDMNIAQRRDNLLGTNQFPNTNEKADTKIDFSVTKPKTFYAENAISKPLTQYRGAMAFESLRMKTDRHSHRPVVFLLTLGNPAMRKARATFAYNFFACAGFEVIDNLGFKTTDEGLQAAFAANADIIVVCSSDEEYPVFAPEAFDKINNKAITVVAGYPTDSVEALKAKGITNFIHVKTNLLEALQYYQKLLKIV